MLKLTIQNNSLSTWARMVGCFVISTTVGAFDWQAAILFVRMRTTARNTPRRTTTHSCLVIATLALEALNWGRDPLFNPKKVPAKPQTMGQEISPLVDVI